MAPEILLGAPHDATVDWWSLVLLPMNCTGVPPFSKTPDQVFEKILNHELNGQKEMKQCQNLQRNLYVNYLTKSNERYGSENVLQK